MAGSHLNFQTGQNETFRSFPELSGSCFDVKSISSMTSEDFFRGLLIQWSASAVCHSLSDISRPLVQKNRHYLNILPTFLPWLCCLPFRFLVHHFFDFWFFTWTILPTFYDFDSFGFYFSFIKKTCHSSLANGWPQSQQTPLIKAGPPPPPPLWGYFSHLWS